jgi:preprotein translocase subunit YajC
MTQILLAAEAAKGTAQGAAEGVGQEPSLIGSLLGNPIMLFVLMFVILYFFMIRPQQKRQKEIQNFQNSLQEGTPVVLGGGIYGTVKKIDLATNTIEVKIADGVVIKVDKNSVYKDMASTAQK